MSSSWSKSGPNDLNQFLMSGVPFVTSSLTTAIPGRDTADATSGGTDISPVRISFPYVTKWVTVKNIGINTLRIGFSEEGILSKDDYYDISDPNTADGKKKLTENLNCFLLRSTGSDKTSGGLFHPVITKVGANASLDPTITFNVRCTDMYFVSDISRPNPGGSHSTGISVIAGLTTIPRDEFPTLTGSINGTNAFEGV
jgi:hypothetical protein